MTVKFRGLSLSQFKPLLDKAPRYIRLPTLRRRGRTAGPLPPAPKISRRYSLMPRSILVSTVGATKYPAVQAGAHPGAPRRHPLPSTNAELLLADERTDVAAVFLRAIRLQHNCHRRNAFQDLVVYAAPYEDA